ncbi:MAG: type II toxin-antitoxin system HicB family antitoxin [Flavobacteriaceae bacterium]|jgi:predicted RNase H-like HicB family nuclease|nr:type II toxin-antitoxin system HicB family antitoxin [Flavobacteriaceae bacterium]
MKIIDVLVKKGANGVYWGTTQNIPGVITADGATFEEMKTNLSEALELAKESDDSYADYGLDFHFKLSLKDFFTHFPELKKSEIGQRAGISKTLMSQYLSEREVYISYDRVKEIEKEIHLLADELKTVSFD